MVGNSINLKRLERRADPSHEPSELGRSLRKQQFGLLSLPLTVTVQENLLTQIELCCIYAPFLNLKARSKSSLVVQRISSLNELSKLILWFDNALFHKNGGLDSGLWTAFRETEISIFMN